MVEEIFTEISDWARNTRPVIPLRGIRPSAVPVNWRLYGILGRPMPRQLWVKKFLSSFPNLVVEDNFIVLHWGWESAGVTALLFWLLTHL